MYEKKPFFFHLYLQRSGPEGTSIERNPRLPIEKTGRSLQQFPEYSTGKNNCCKSREGIQNRNFSRNCHLLEKKVPLMFESFQKYFLLLAKME
jgi:hypothetical protein